MQHLGQIKKLKQKRMIKMSLEILTERKLKFMKFNILFNNKDFSKEDRLQKMVRLKITLNQFSVFFLKIYNEKIQLSYLMDFRIVLEFNKIPQFLNPLFICIWLIYLLSQNQIMFYFQEQYMQSNQPSIYYNPYASMQFYQHNIIHINQNPIIQIPSLIQFYQQKPAQNIQIIRTCEQIDEPSVTQDHKNKKITLRKKISKQMKFMENSISDQDSEFQINKNPRKLKKKSSKTIKKTPPKQQRNIIPNLIQQVFSFLSKKVKSGIFARKVLNSLKNTEGSELEINRYFIFQKRIKQRLDHCVNLQTLSILSNKDHPKLGEIKICFDENEIMIYQKVSRILAFYFFRSISPLLTVYSKRMPTQKRNNHLFHRRIIQHQLRTLMLK